MPHDRLLATDYFHVVDTDLLSLRSFPTHWQQTILDGDVFIFLYVQEHMGIHTVPLVIDWVKGPGHWKKTEDHLERQEHHTQVENQTDARPGHLHIPVQVWVMDTDSWPGKENTSCWDEIN